MVLTATRAVMVLMLLHLNLAIFQTIPSEKGARAEKAEPRLARNLPRWGQGAMEKE